uniref:Uncharacterized protein n=1 Tax=Acrobeloides nanus TaxID=290746 RepID=A0A914CTK7_9BILA
MNSKLREQITTLEVERNNYQRQSREYREKLELEAEHRGRAEAEVNILKAEVDKNRGMLSGILAMAINSAVPTSSSRFVPE